ncbi:MAG: DNA-processing protein DprA [Actinomycetota bacterium]
MNDRDARVILFSCIEGGNVFWTREVEEIGAVETINKARENGYHSTVHEKIATRISTTSSKEQLSRIQEAHLEFIVPEDATWPLGVNDLVAPPFGLTIKGDSTILALPSLAIVGTRNPTNYGVRAAGEFASGFADRDWVITSGGAYGIDAAAHRGALVAEGSTIAILACGIDINYPAGHMRLFAEICESGALVSEVMPGVHAIPARFLTRNRLIAAISSATLVVEAAFRSGSLRTARDAAELLRPVMAVPGPITSPTSEGCHRLIGERAAEIVTSVADAVEFVSTSK